MFIRWRGGGWLKDIVEGSEATQHKARKGKSSSCKIEIKGVLLYYIINTVVELRD
jgi:hypothetical protein